MATLVGLIGISYLAKKIGDGLSYIGEKIMDAKDYTMNKIQSLKDAPRNKERADEREKIREKRLAIQKKYLSKI